MNDEQNFDEAHYDFQLSLSIEDVKILHYSVDKALEMWAGGDPEEQEDLYRVRDTFRRMLLDYTFRNM